MYIYYLGFCRYLKQANLHADMVAKLFCSSCLVPPEPLYVTHGLIVQDNGTKSTYRVNGLPSLAPFPVGRMRLAVGKFRHRRPPSRFPTGCAAHARAYGLSTQPRGSEIRRS